MSDTDRVRELQAAVEFLVEGLKLLAADMVNRELASSLRLAADNADLALVRSRMV